MFDEAGLLTRTWVIFFERLGRLIEERLEELEAAEEEIAAQIVWANFGVVGGVTAGDEVTTPVDLSIPAGASAKALFARANLKTASTTGNVAVTLEYSTDPYETPAPSRTWPEVSAAGVALTVLEGNHQMDAPVAAFSADPLVFENNDTAPMMVQIRMNVDAAGAGAEGLNVSLAMELG